MSFCPPVFARFIVQPAPWNCGKNERRRIAVLGLQLPELYYQHGQGPHTVCRILATVVQASTFPVPGCFLFGWLVLTPHSVYGSMLEKPTHRRNDDRVTQLDMLDFQMVSQWLNKPAQYRFLTDLSIAEHNDIWVTSMLHVRTEACIFSSANLFLCTT